MKRTNLYNIGSQWEEENATYYDRNGEQMTEESKQLMKEEAERAWIDDIYCDIATAYFLIWNVYGAETAEQFLAEIGYNEETEEAA